MAGQHQQAGGEGGQEDAGFASGEAHGVFPVASASPPPRRGRETGAWAAGAVLHAESLIHFNPLFSFASVSTNRPNRSLAASVPPTV